MMSAITSVIKDGQTYALFCSKQLSTDGACFVTEEKDAFQVGVLERPKGYRVEPHQHTERPAHISTVSEFLYIEKGSIRVTVFDEQWEELERHELSAGDFLLFLRGGHALEVLEDARIVEVKQGPYPGPESAKIFQKEA